MFRLALAQGKTILELQSALGYLDGIPEEYWWIAFANIEGIPQPWLQTASIEAAIRNQYAKKPIAPQQLMPVRKRRDPQSSKLMRAKFHACLGNLLIIDERPAK